MCIDLPYLGFGYALYAEKDYHAAKRCFSLALFMRIERPTTDIISIATGLNNTACALLKVEKTERCQEYLQSACSIYEATEDKLCEEYLVIKKNASNILHCNFHVKVRATKSNA